MNRKLKLSLELVVLLAILCLGAYFRLLNNAAYPGLYNDEGTQINIALNFMQGKTEYLGVEGSLLLFMRMPLFPFLLSLLFRIFSAGLPVVRGFAAALGLLTIALVYLAGRDIFDAHGAAIGLLGALALAIYPKVVMFNRLGISYNLLAPLIIVHFWALCRYWKTKQRSWLLLAAAAVGLGGLVDLVAFTLLPGLVAMAWLTNKRDWWVGLPLVFLPFVLYGAAVMISAPVAFWSDLGFTFQRVSGASFPEQIMAIIFNFGGTLVQDEWFLLGIAGLFLLQPGQLRWIALLVFLPPALIIGRTSYFRIGFYYLFPWMPVLALGLGAFITSAAGLIQSTIQPMMERLVEKIKAPQVGGGAGLMRRMLIALLPALLIFLLVISPIFISILILNNQIVNQTAHQVFNYFDDIRDARIVQSYINERVGKNDLVLASPALAWMLKGHVTDYQIALAAEGQSTAHLPPIPANRLAFAMNFQQARYVVVDAIWLEWAESAMPELTTIRVNMEQSWKKVVQAGSFSVYENPAFSG